MEIENLVYKYCAENANNNKKNTELIFLLRDEKKEMLKRKIKKCFEMEYQLQNCGELLKQIYIKEKDLKNRLQVKMSKEHNNGYAWITINPKPIVKLETFKKLIAKIVKKTCFINYVYVLEQRSPTLEKMGMGFHAHILIKRNLKYKPVKCKQNVIDTLKRAKVIGNWKHGFDYKVIGEEFASDKLDYILGLKTGNKADGTAKADAQKIDVVWRQKNNIDSFYGDKDILSS